MPAIKKLILQNFKKFDSLMLEFDAGVNVLIGDNETGKSSVLLALDLALSASRSRVETIGYESILAQAAVRAFKRGPRTLDLLPTLIVDVFLEEGDDQGFYGTQNTVLERSQNVFWGSGQSLSEASGTALECMFQTALKALYDPLPSVDFC